MNTLLDEPTEVAASLPPSRLPAHCAACDRALGAARGVLCRECALRAPPSLVRAYHAALNAVRVEGQPDRVLEVAIARLVAGVLGKPLPYEQPAPAASTPVSPTPPSSDPGDMSARKTSATCTQCARDFTYTYRGTGRRRTRCDRCASNGQAPPAKSARRREAGSGKQPAKRAAAASAGERPDPADVFNVADARARIQSDLDELEARRARLARLLEAFDAYEAAE